MAHDVDLLLINPGSRFMVYQSLGSELAAIEPPVWAGLIATFVRRNGFSVAVLDANAEGLSVDQTAERIGQANPLLAAVVVYGHQPSASTQNMVSVGAICSTLKNKYPDIKIILVGGHVSALPERTLAEDAADFTATGEGPYTLLDLLQVLKSPTPEAYEKVRGLCFRHMGEIRVTEPAPLVRDLDREMPELAWDLLPMDKSRAHNWHTFGNLKRHPYAAIYTTLGCPYHCAFCCIQAPFKKGEQEMGLKENVNSYRFWSPESVVRQIDRLVSEYGVRNIKFADEMFVLNRGHVEKICDLLIERNYDLNIWAYARVDTVRDDILDKLHRAGILWLAFGIESGSAKVRDASHKSFAQDQIVQAIQKVKSAGINIIANYVFGLPDEDQASMQATLDLALELNCEFANFYCAMAYPGSELYRQALREGWKIPEKWSGYSQHSVDSLPLATKHLSAAEMVRFRDHAFNTYFSNPAYLAMIEKKFGPDTVRHIREMAHHKLIRLNA